MHSGERLLERAVLPEVEGRTEEGENGRAHQQRAGQAPRASLAGSSHQVQPRLRSTPG